MSARKAGWPWSALGLDSHSATLREVKSAYAMRLKQIDHNDPDQFQPLQEAFAAAKARAKAADGPRQQAPRMAQIMAEKGAPVPPPTPDPRPEPSHETAPAPEPAPGPVPVPKPKPKPQPEPKDTATDASDPWPAKRHPVPQPEPAPAPPPPGPKPGPQPGPAKPWGASSDDLNPLYARDPWAAEQTYFAKLEKVLAWPVQMESLARMLDLELLRDPAIKRRTERQIFNAIAENITDFSTPMPAGMATLLEEHFQWSTDGVGLSRRFGMMPAFQRVVHCYSATRPSQGTSTFDLDKRPWLAMKLGLWLLVSLIVLSKMSDELNLTAVVVSVVVALMLVAIARTVLIFASIPLMLVPGLVPLVTRLARRFAPNLAADLGRSKQMRGLALWLASSVPVILMFIFG